jgi:ribosomal protein S12 methylthiotransferase
VDTEIILGQLRAAGWEVCGAPEEASLLLVNTCAFIAPASQEAVDTVLELARHKEADPGKRLVVAGCLVQRYGPELPHLLPEVDIFVGVNDFPGLPQILEQEPGVAGRLFCRAPLYDYREPQPRFAATPSYLAYLKIAEGCSNPCTFCVLPRIRGAYRSRPLQTLVAEALSLAAAGVKELVLVAQDTTAYGQEWGGRPGLAELLQQLCQIPGFKWLRVLYAHPARLTPKLLETMAAHPQICPYLDLPLQHAADELLRRMGRGYGRRQLLETLRLVRGILPQAALRTSIMLGFPGETDRHFQEVLDLVAEVRFDHLGIFLFSPEEGTAAARFGPRVPRRLARARARRLKALQACLVQERLKSLVGSCQPVLVEGVSRESDFLLAGRLVSQAPEIDGQVYITAGVGRVGEIQTVRLTRALPYDLVGELVAGGDPGAAPRSPRKV